MNFAVVKVGGSLLLYPENLRALCSKLSEVSRTHRLIVVPGGGAFVDVVRSLDKKFSISCEVSHRMAILGMDQYGLLLSDLIPNSAKVRNLEEINYFIDSGRLPVFLPSNLLLKEDPLENSWDVTSDSIAVYFAHRLRVSTVLLVKDVDGICLNNPKKHPNTKLIKNLSANQLLAMNKLTSVDKALPKQLLNTSIDCFVVNGLFPERIEAVLGGRDTIHTLING
jgi:5-(aminomethyl)-3-furanmethanol phosphate kinase